MMTARERLPDRRANQSFTFELNGLRYHATISCFAHGRVGEVFITNTKPSSQSDVNARDAAVAASLALQFGCPLDVLRKALLRDPRGLASSPLGLAAALAYGLAVFPARPDKKCSYKSAKYSNGARWGATSDPAEIRADFTRWSDARIGIPTGAINKLIVIETDTEAGHGVDGAASLAQLEAKHGALPNTLMACSPSDSIHRYFRHPGNGIKVRNSASELGAGIDVRGDGGMVIAP
jgi:hypothetical protein